MPVPRRSGLPALFCAAALLAGPAGAQSEREGAKPAASPLGRDCADVSVEYVDVPGLTREERIARMDAAFARSLGRFEECQQARSSSGGGGGGAGSTAAGDISGAAAGASGSGGGAKESSAAAERPPDAADPAAGAVAGGSGETTEARETETAAAEPNGKAPEDIPPADNDSVLEAMIRKAATEETDPEVKKRLWNEYRRYKGLPARE